MKLLSADDMRIYHQKPTTPEELKEALNCQRFRVFSRGSRSTPRLCLFKKSDSSRCDKNYGLTKREGGKDWFISKRNREFVKRVSRYEEG